MRFILHCRSCIILLGISTWKTGLRSWDCIGRSRCPRLSNRWAVKVNDSLYRLINLLVWSVFEDLLRKTGAFLLFNSRGCKCPIEALVCLPIEIGLEDLNYNIIPKFNFNLLDIFSFTFTSIWQLLLICLWWLKNLLMFWAKIPKFWMQ